MRSCSKLLCYTIITSILNSSFYPLYAVHSHSPNSLEDIVNEESHSRRPCLLALEDYLQEKIKNSTHVIQEKTPDFIKNPVSHMYQKACSWLEKTIMDAAPIIAAKTPAEIGQDPIFWRAHFTSEIEDFKNFKVNQKRLEELQDIVWSGVLSPYHYEQGLKDLKDNKSDSLLKRVIEQFHQDLNRTPGLLRGNLHRDLFVSLEEIQNTGKGIEDFESVLSYYRPLHDPFDYTNSMFAFRYFIRSNKEKLKLAEDRFWDLNRVICKAILQRDQQQYRASKSRYQFIQSALQELPYYDGDIFEDVFNSSLPVPTNTKEKPSSFLKPIVKLTYKGMKYVAEHPFEAITIGLASQVAATAALNAFKVDPSKTPQSKQDLKPEPIEALSGGQSTQNQNTPFQKRGIPEHPTPLIPRHFKRNIGDEFQINQETDNNQWYSSVARLSNDNVFVAWRGDQGGIANLYGRVFFPNGTAFNNENKIPTANAGRSAVVGLNNSNIFMTWAGNPNVDYNIYGAVLSSNGTVLNNVFEINQNTTGMQSLPAVTNLNNGNLFVAWQGYQSGNFDIYGRIFFPNGTAFGEEFGINQHTTSSQTVPSVARLGNRNIFVVWPGNQNLDSNVYGRIFFPNGTAFGEEFGINQITTAYQGWASLAPLNDGNIFVAWEGQQSGNYDIYGCAFFPNGTALGNEVRMNQITTADQRFPSVKTLANGNIFIAWQDNQSGDNDITGNVFFPNGTSLGTAFGINQITNSDQYYPAVASLSNGNVFVAWEGYLNGTLDIYGRILTPSIIPALGTTTTSSVSMTLGTTGTTSSPSTGSMGTTDIAASSSPSSSGSSVASLSGMTIVSSGSSISSTTDLQTSGTTRQKSTTDMSTTDVITTDAIASSTSPTITTARQSTTIFPTTSSLASTAALATTGTTRMNSEATISGTSSHVTTALPGATSRGTNTIMTTDALTGRFTTGRVTSSTSDGRLLDSSPNNDDTLLIAIPATIGGVVLLGTAAVGGYYLYKKHRGTKYVFSVGPQVNDPEFELNTSIQSKHEEDLKPINKAESNFGEELEYDSEQGILSTANWKNIRETPNKVQNEENSSGIKEEIKTFLSSTFAPLPKNYLQREDEYPFKTVLMSFKYLKHLHPQLKDRPEQFYKTFFSYKWKSKIKNPQQYEDYHNSMHCIVGHCAEAGLSMIFDMWDDRPGTLIYKFAEKIITEANKVILVATTNLLESYKGEGESVIKAELPMIQRKATGKENSIIILLMETEEKIKELLPPSLLGIASKPFYETQKYCDNIIDLMEYMYELNHNDPYLKRIRYNFEKRRILKNEEIVREIKEIKKSLEERENEEKELLSDKPHNWPLSPSAHWNTNA